MLCPNCKQEIPDGNRCPLCKVDIIVFKKIVRLSDSLYNRGLALAKKSDLSGAAALLYKSVQINKDNVQAYNLLGLVHFEMGNIGEAVKNWVISSNRFKENNPAAGYIDELTRNNSTLERYNDAVSKYNGALTYLKQKNEDLAIIQLKKAVEINPKFISALNLLTLCCLIQQDKERASQLMDRVLSIDAQNPIAANYFNVLHPGRKFSNRTQKSPGTSTPVVTRATPPPEPAYRQTPIKEKPSINFHLAEIISFVIGVVCTFAVFYFLLMPAVRTESEQVQEQLQLEAIGKEQDFLKQIKEKSDQITGLETSINDLEENAEAENERYEILLNTNRVYQAYIMYTDGKLQEAVDFAGGINLIGQPPDIIERHQSILTLAYPQLAKIYFDEGTEAYNDDDYAKARVDFEKAYFYVLDDASYMNDLIYRMGYTYAQDESTKEQAIEFLNAYLDAYANISSSRRNTVRNLLADLTEE